MIVSIKFCGGCNPRIDRGKIAEGLNKIFENLGISVVWNSLDADLIVFISGCATSCACRWVVSDTPSVVIASTTVNHREVTEEDIIPSVARIIRTHIEKSHHHEGT
jgi:hypothetical protein